MRFDRCHLINLDRRPDRLASFRERFPASWPGPEPVRVSAVDGEKVPPPSWFTQQPGAYACLRSHLRLWEDAISRGESLFVFEDDCVFAPDFGERIGPFLGAVPADWDMVYLGGLHRAPATHPPVRVNDRVHLARAVTTTYAYGVSARFLPVLYRTLMEAEQHHIDQMIARAMAGSAWRVYCPVPWLVGMDAGLSDICGRFYQHPHFWEYTEKSAEEPIVLHQLLSKVELRDGVWHDVPLTAPQARPKLTSTIPGWFTPECGEAYRRTARRAAALAGGKAVLVEVGCWRGRSLSFLADLVLSGEVEAHAVDTWKGNVDPRDPTHGRDVYEDFRANMARLGVGDILRVRREPSVVAAGAFAPGSCDVVMIDASHDYESVRADLRAWWPRVRAGGVLMGHDYGAACLCPEVVRAVDEFAAEVGLAVEAEADLWFLRKECERHEQCA